MQFHIPSVEQAVPAAIAEPAPVVPVLAGVDAGEAFDAAALVTSVVGLADATREETGAEVGADSVACEGGTVAKTPPGGDTFEDAEAMGAEVAIAAGALGAPPLAAVPAGQPLGIRYALGPVPDPMVVTESPGSGNLRSPCGVSQFPMFATNMSGRAL